MKYSENKFTVYLSLKAFKKRKMRSGISYPTSVSA